MIYEHPFSYDQLMSLLGRSENDPVVTNFFGHEISNIHRDEYYGSLEFSLKGSMLYSRKLLG